MIYKTVNLDLELYNKIKESKKGKSFRCFIRELLDQDYKKVREIVIAEIQKELQRRNP